MRGCVALLVLLGTAVAQSLGLQISLGLTSNAPTDLRVVQRGYPSTVVEGVRFEGRDLEGFPYYTVRLWYGERVGLRYELELIHQKLYFAAAESNRGIFEQFNVTDGFNYVLFNLAYALEAGPLRVVPRVGLGALVVHPETVVRGQGWGVDGDPRWYHLGGLGGQWAVGLEAPWVVTPGLEGKLTIGYSRLNIAGGYAEGWFRSLHGTFGLGWP
ncbi:hypothetical protein [Meiothermus sp.]|uniref:hypothetical protein n=1 Tax=Meiothermus sp. TaxID=1955249 RepID=UPI0021DE05C3|nr:hypothetical protein [Meiothermus sp.]GIW33570.1 MAG: hypothetical protein KatS3mg072_0903 [Meiothermus sp.]